MADTASPALSPSPIALREPVGIRDAPPVAAWLADGSDSKCLIAGKPCSYRCVPHFINDSITCIFILQQSWATICRSPETYQLSDIYMTAVEAENDLF